MISFLAVLSFFYISGMVWRVNIAVLLFQTAVDSYYKVMNAKWGLKWFYQIHVFACIDTSHRSTSLRPYFFSLSCFNMDLHYSLVGSSNQTLVA